MDWVPSRLPARAVQQRFRNRDGKGVTVLASFLLLAGCARHYRVDGMVLRVDPLKRTILVSHRDIRGYMPAMVMAFPVKRSAEIAGLQPGARVHFRLAVKGRSAIAERIEARAPSETLPLPPLPEKLAIGAAVPDFSLIDQTGTPVRLSGLRGKVVALDFIYTRCPLPDVCPRLSANFARLQRRFEKRLGVDFALLSITIDPQYDTPAILANYAKLWKANPIGWHFLTGDPVEIEHVAANFGMQYFPEEGSMTHTSETAIVARDGTLAAVVSGPAYAVSQLGDLIAGQLDIGQVETP
ncbi:MAG: SCO family protein [Acidobacteriota bacterium]|nr:SCO family protein [Acidobacteriota bacterium]